MSLLSIIWRLVSFLLWLITQTFKLHFLSWSLMVVYCHSFHRFLSICYLSGIYDLVMRWFYLSFIHTTHHATSNWYSEEANTEHTINNWSPNVCLFWIILHFQPFCACFPVWKLFSNNIEFKFKISVWSPISRNSLNNQVIFDVNGICLPNNWLCITIKHFLNQFSLYNVFTSFLLLRPKCIECHSYSFLQ